MHKRFYDHDPKVAQAVQLLMIFPPEIKILLADSMSLIAEQEYAAGDLLKNLKSLGTDRVLSIYKSKQKRRDYDQCPHTHRAMNYLMILPPEQRILLAHKVIELMAYIQDYMQTCQQYGRPLQNNEMEGLTQTFVHLGGDQVQELLRRIRKDFSDTLDKKASVGTRGSLTENATPNRPKPAPVANQTPSKDVPPREAQLSEAIRDEGVGMRIKGDLKP